MWTLIQCKSYLSISVITLQTSCYFLNKILCLYSSNGKALHAKAALWTSAHRSCFSEMTNSPKSLNWEAAAWGIGCRGNKCLNWSVSGWQSKQITVYHHSSVAPVKTSRPGSWDACFHFLAERLIALYLGDFTSFFFFLYFYYWQAEVCNTALKSELCQMRIRKGSAVKNRTAKQQEEKYEHDCMMCKYQWHSVCFFSYCVSIVTNPSWAFLPLYFLPVPYVRREIQW